MCQRLRGTDNSVRYISVMRTNLGVDVWGELDYIRAWWVHMIEQPGIFTLCGWDVLSPHWLVFATFPFPKTLAA